MQGGEAGAGFGAGAGAGGAALHPQGGGAGFGFSANAGAEGKYSVIPICSLVQKLLLQFNFIKLNERIIQ